MTVEEDTQYPLVDLYDHEVLALEGVLNKLHEKQRSHQNLEAFRKEIVERCAEIGIAVYAKIYETNEEGVYAFEVEIRGRTEGGFVFDPDRQVAEVTEDILDLLPASEKGEKIKTSGLIVPGGSHKH
jgi:hypothetical protein